MALAHFYKTEKAYLIHVTRDPYEYGCDLSHTNLLMSRVTAGSSEAALGINIKKPNKNWCWCLAAAAAAPRTPAFCGGPKLRSSGGNNSRWRKQKLANGLS